MAEPARKIDDLAEAISQFVYDPLGYVYFVFPWGEPGTFLSDADGPDSWQRDILKSLGDGLLTMEEAVQIAVASGHGIGKTALIAWIIKWFVATRPSPQVVCTANTREQLEKKTWRELSKWNKVALDGHLFTWTATKFYLTDSPEDWFAAAVPWSKERTEAFAGTHEKHVLVLFDEASAIDDKIWEVTEGAMTTKGAAWICFGNPTKNTGRFRECFGRFKHRWVCRQIDSRTAKMANKKQIQQWVDDYGEDSDFVRVRVKGAFPRAGSAQFIGSDIVEAAAGRVIHPDAYKHAAKVLGVDVARFGDDQTVFYLRQGLATIMVVKVRGKDTMWIASKAAAMFDEYNCDGLFIDDTGVGGGVTDRLRQLGYNPIAVVVGESAMDDHKYFNKRAEIWGRLRDWLAAGGCIPDDVELKQDLTGPEYGFDAKERLQIEKKIDMKARGLASPDTAEALALTFAQTIVPRDPRERVISQLQQSGSEPLYWSDSRHGR